jgi:hypothetical protein
MKPPATVRKAMDLGLSAVVFLAQQKQKVLPLALELLADELQMELFAL